MNILMIGNGFDLAHGLPTRYRDFLRMVEKFGQIKNHELDIVNGGLENITDSLRQYLIKLCFVEESKYREEFFDLIQENIWIKYMTIDSLVKDNNWIDFESEISKVIYSLDIIKNRKSFHKKSSLKIETSYVTSILSAYMNVNIKDINDILHDINEYNKFTRCLHNDLNRLIRALEIYLTDYVEQIKCCSISPDIIDIKPDKILSFNYTNTYEALYSDGKSIEYDYIHGKANIDNTIDTNNMVLGIDEYLIDDRKNKDLEFIAFKKYYQRIYKRTGCKYRDWLYKIKKEYEKGVANSHEKMNNDSSKVFSYSRKETPDLFSSRYQIHNLYIYGHSLDVTDGDILRDLILNDNVKTTIYYLNLDVYGKQITNLVRVIGQDELIKRTGGSKKTIEFKKQVEMVEKL